MKNIFRFLISTMVLALAFSTLSRAQDVQTYSGIVVDSNGEALPGVAVIVQGGGGLTDEKGEYKVTAKPGSDIQFSCLGF